MNEGYCKLHRKLFNSELWLKEKFTKGQAWIDLFANANFMDSFFEIRGNKIEIKRGQLGWSEITMSKRWGWSRNRTRRFLKWLEMEQQIEQQKLSKLTTITTIINYDKYQQTEQQNVKNDTTDDTTDGTHRIKDNKIKEERTPLSKEKIWEIAKKNHVSFESVNKKHQEVLNAIEENGPTGKKIISVNLTTQRWLNISLDRGYIQRLDGLEWEIEMDDHEPSRVEKRNKAKLKIKEDEKNGKPIFDFTKFRKQ